MLEHRKSARANAVRRAWLGAVVLLAGPGVLAGRALADAECGDTEPPKATKGACPAGYKYSAKKKGCAKVSCGTGGVWSGEQHACIDGHSAALTDQDFYTEAVALADEGHFREALDLLTRIKKQEQSRVLNMVGYTTRKLGDVDKGLELALDPSMTTATASSTLLAASAVLLGLTLIVPQAFAVEEMRQFNKDDTKTWQYLELPQGRAIQREKALLRQNELRHRASVERRG
jgi:hypothetical protein